MTGHHWNENVSIPNLQKYFQRQQSCKNNLCSVLCRVLGEEMDSVFNIVRLFLWRCNLARNLRNVCHSRYIWCAHINIWVLKRARLHKFTFDLRKYCYLWTFANRSISPVLAHCEGIQSVPRPLASVFSIILIARLEIGAPEAQNLAKSTLSRTQECWDPIGISDSFSALRIIAWLNRHQRAGLERTYRDDCSEGAISTSAREGFWALSRILRSFELNLKHFELILRDFDRFGTL